MKDSDSSHRHQEYQDPNISKLPSTFRILHSLLCITASVSCADTTSSCDALSCAKLAEEVVVLLVEEECDTSEE